MELAPREVVEFWLTAPVLHSLAAHFPIALALLGAPLVFAAAVASRSQALRGVAFGCYVLVAGTGFLAMYAGRRVRELLPGDLPPDTWRLVNDHEVLGNQIWILGGITALLLAVSSCAGELSARGGDIAGDVGEFGDAWDGSHSPISRGRH